MIMTKRELHFHLPYHWTIEFPDKLSLEGDKYARCKIFIETSLKYEIPVNAKASSDIELLLFTTLT